MLHVSSVWCISILQVFFGLQVSLILMELWTCTMLYSLICQDLDSGPADSNSALTGLVSRLAPTLFLFFFLNLHIRSCNL